MTQETIRLKCHRKIKLRYALMCNNVAVIEQVAHKLGGLV